jgi:hypothetical protein
MAFDDHDFRAIASPTQEELIDARERTDAGMRLAFPHLFDRSDPPPFVPPPLDAEAEKRVSSKLLDAQAAIHEAAMEVPLEGEPTLHERFNALRTELDYIAVSLTERFGS